MFIYVFTTKTIIERHQLDRKMRYLRTIVILSVIAYLSMFLTEISTIEAFNIIKVPAHYSTIQNGINAANPGDIILVSSGTYRENLVVNKAVTLRGEDTYSTIIDGGGANSVIMVTANNVVIEGFTIRRSGGQENVGIYIRYVNGCVITTNILKECGIAIRLDRSFNNTIEENVITDSNSGIHIWYLASNNTVSNNIMTGNGNALELLAFTHDNNIIGNEIANNTVGIYGDHSSNNRIEKNLIKKSSLWGIRLYGSICKNNLIANNTIEENRYGVYIFVSENNALHHNNFVNNTIQAYVEPMIPVPSNTWNSAYPDGGNYWSNYLGKDLFSGASQDVNGSDGIGDKPYIISENNIDHYPLINPVILHDNDNQTYTPSPFLAALIIFFVAMAVSSVLFLVLRQKAKTVEPEDNKEIRDNGSNKLSTGFSF